MNEKTVRVVGEVLAERGRQNEKWGHQDHDLPVWLTVLTEEVGELAKAILDERFYLGMDADRASLIIKRQGIRIEALQAAAVAVALVEYLDRHTCRSCGCTDEAGCAEGCWWIEPGLCSRCKAGEAEKAAGIAEAGREATAI